MQHLSRNPPRYKERAPSGGQAAHKDQGKQGDILSYMAKEVGVLIKQGCRWCMQILMKFVI